MSEPMYVLYEKPVDYPDHFVIRVHREKGGIPVPDDELFAKCDTVVEAISKIPKGLVFVERAPNDPAAVVGTWI